MDIAKEGRYQLKAKERKSDNYCYCIRYKNNDNVKSKIVKSDNNYRWQWRIPIKEAKR